MNKMIGELVKPEDVSGALIPAALSTEWAEHMRRNTLYVSETTSAAINKACEAYVNRPPATWEQFNTPAGQELFKNALATMAAVDSGNVDTVMFFTVNEEED